MTLRCVCPSLCACVCVGGFVLISDISVYLCVQLKRVIRSDGFVCVCVKHVQRMWVAHLRSGQRSQLRCPPAPCAQTCTSPLQSCPSAAGHRSATRSTFGH